MTLCNMAIEAGARAGMVAVDDKTIEYLQAAAPSRRKGDLWDQRGGPLAHAAHGRGREVRQGGARLRRRGHHARMVTWGTSPEMVLDSNDSPIRPTPTRRSTIRSARQSVERALHLHGTARPTCPSPSIRIDKVFIGSCTNSRIEDHARGGRRGERRVRVAAWPATSSWRWSCRVPGLVKRASRSPRGSISVFKRGRLRMARARLFHVSRDERRPSGGQASAAPPPRNRNFEGRQGAGGRTHLVSPAMAAAAAIDGPVRRRPPTLTVGNHCHGEVHRIAHGPGGTAWIASPTSTPTRSSRSSS